MNYKLTTIRIAFIGVYIALIYGLKLALSFIPNVEVVTLLMTMGAVYMPYWAVILSVMSFNLLELVTYGFGDWWVFYMLVWPLLVTICSLFKKSILKHWWIAVIIMTLFGFLFGTLNTGVRMFFYGFNGAMAYWVAGFTFDLVHGVANMLVGVALTVPVMKVMNIYMPRIFNKPWKIEKKWDIENDKPAIEQRT
ncbi:hypothetical protein [Williamsoniiplasma lucivorax]|uniref:ECF transporter S component n=1 Tax=Williamsoniiplasma lucivorax TaxID=209274 RepID=A0A2S5RAK9_9MOLU|nr:hypothetical protein [Williamsoniiplasma lucivorax]PPE04155.1 hypothetical protein ELUCI_v1c09350 [Williamsoniiplasma lucivorax]